MRSTRHIAVPMKSAVPPSERSGRNRRHSSRAAAALAAALLAGACQEPTATSLHEHDAVPFAAASDIKLSDALKEIRQVTARFHSVEQALGAGYVPTEHCVASPLGGMGMHWANMTIIDPVFDPLRPEVVLYEPMPNGRPRLVAVEYIVINVGQPRPELDGRLFDIGGTPTPAPHWSLHVWLHKHNPNGVFTPFNPDVSCS